MIDIKILQEAEFETQFRGYSKTDVDKFIEEVTEKVTEQNAAMEELERKYAALRVRIDELEENAAQKQAEQELLIAQAQAQLDAAREEAERIRSEADADAKDLSFRTKFEADKTIAAAKREAMLMKDDSAQKAQALKLASQRAADKIITEAKAEATEITAAADDEAKKITDDARAKGEEMITAAQASVQSEREVWTALRRSVIAISGELSRILTAQLGETAEFTQKIGSCTFGTISEGTLANVITEDEPEKPVAPKPVQQKPAQPKPAEPPKPVEPEIAEPELPEEPEIIEEPEVAYAESEDLYKTEDELREEEIARALRAMDDARAAEFEALREELEKDQKPKITVLPDDDDDDTYDYSDEDVYLSSRAQAAEGADAEVADDDTYGYTGEDAVADGTSVDFMSADLTGSNTESALPGGRTRPLTADELDSIFSFDVEEIMNEGKDE